MKSIKNISPALCSTAGFHKPWSPEVFPVLEPEVQLAKQIPESLALLSGPEFLAGEPLPHICTISQPVKSEEVCGPGRLTAGLASAGLSTAQLCSAFFPESRSLACPVQPPEIVK